MTQSKNCPPEYEIREISATETYPVRHPVLRSGRPLASCAFDGDNLKTTFHLGIYENNQLVGVATLLEKNHPDFSFDVQYQLRGMAILKSHQQKGLGKQLLTSGEVLLASKQIRFIWCNAREIAINFYKNNGFRLHGNSFEIPKIGMHFTMYKRL